MRYFLDIFHSDSFVAVVMETNQHKLLLIYCRPCQITSHLTFKSFTILELKANHT